MSLARSAFYPYATQRLLKPELHSEPDIVGCLAVLHTHGFAGSSEAVGNYFDRDTVHVESHVSVKLNGRVLQFQSFTKQADAQGSGNGFRRAGRLHGAISIEAEDNPAPGNPYTQDQVASIGMLLAWLHQEHGIPLHRATAWNGDGVGWHSLFREWNKNRHACPGTARVGQIPEIVDVARWFLALAHAEDDLTEVVDSIRFLDGVSGWDLQRDGGVITKGDASFFGSYPGLPAEHRNDPGRRFGSIDWHGMGYKLTSTAGETYHFPATS